MIERNLSPDWSTRFSLIWCHFLYGWWCQDWCRKGRPICESKDDDIEGKTHFQRRLIQSSQSKADTNLGEIPQMFLKKNPSTRLLRKLARSKNLFWRKSQVMLQKTDNRTWHARASWYSCWEGTPDDVKKKDKAPARCVFWYAWLLINCLRKKF